MTINKVFGGDSKVEFVNEIEPAKSGKYLYTVGEVKQ
jgi:hypothetical protein